MNTDAPIDQIEMDHWERWWLGVATAALLVCAVAMFFRPAQFFRAYLPAYLFLLGIALGSMAMLMAHHLTGGSWGWMLRRIFEAAVGTLPLLAGLFLPIAVGIGYLYPWAQAGAVAASPKLQYQQFYLNPTGFWVRAAAYFALWLIMAFLLRRWSDQEDRTVNPRLAWKSRQLSAFGAVLYGVSIHFAAIDWGMSVQPEFHSTIWGPLVALGQLLSAFSFALVVFGCVVNRPPLRTVASLKVRNDLGSLLLTLLILWAYMAWFQFMLGWMANLPADAVWHLARASAGWKAVIWTIFALNFAIPFFLLLMRPIKRNSRAVAAIATVILFMQLAFTYYLITPGFPADCLSEHWMDFLTPVGLGGLWLAYFVRQLQQRPLLALHDHNRASAVHLCRLDEEEAARDEATAHG